MQRDLAELARLRKQLGSLEARFNEKRWQIEGMLRRGADIERGKHWVRLQQSEAMRLLLDE
jgi:hypothetical protein